MSEALAHISKIARDDLLFRAMVDPLWLAREIMGYDRVTDDFHGPMMKEMWERDLQRPLIRAAIAEQVGSGLLDKHFLKLIESKPGKLRGRAYEKNEGECWSREHYKTTVFIVRCAKLILLWPEITVSHWHAVEKNAIECSLELGNHFQKNAKFRQLRMSIMPKTTDKRFNTSAGFTVNTRQIIGGKFQKRDRHPTFYPKGAGAEVTGMHSIVGWLDDIVGQGTIDDSGMPKVRSWLGKTVLMVVRKDGGWLMATYTPWDEDDVMVDWEKNKRLWDIRTRACWKDDDKLEGILYDKKYLMRLKHDPQCDFPYQMECDRVPDSERRWPIEWNGHEKLGWCMEGHGRVFVLSDPAPMGLSLRGDKDRVRGDTGKDWWAISVVRLRVRGDFQDLILLDGSASQSWSDAQGYDEACRLMQKWRTNMFFDEDYSGGQHFETFLKACKRAGVMPYTELDSKHRRVWPKYNESYQKGAKNKRFQKMCDAATNGAVWISDSCPDSFWYGDGDVTGALTQAKKWIPRARGESSLKKDDHFDCWARSTDSVLQKFAPQPSRYNPGSNSGGNDPFNRNRYNRKASGPTLTRYI